MPAILYIKASPRGPRSHSIAVADAFLEAYQEANPQYLVTTRNLFEDDLPPFDGPTLQAKYNVLHGLTHDPAQQRAWQQVKRYVDELKDCARIVMAVPMWNFSLPYRLKHYIDLVVQPGLSFGVNEDGAFGLIPDKPVFIAYASGGAYPPGSGAAVMDHQKPYLEMILGYMGLKDVRSVRVEATLSSDAQVEESRSGAIAKAREMAKDF
ncbi:FMN-dependent NADH-azoreductase [Fundidesulfovibrio putealis]|uniref:FMN-dependent NADH-azoreductase n=1 Tax=Fundidesulfovibrio putealis TaxID=270496 RepID=UPI0003FE1398|nr:NAD(P)H-dependent oxidoreductase [Fundidesulfovibrio putealis]